MRCRRPFPRSVRAAGSLGKNTTGPGPGPPSPGAAAGAGRRLPSARPHAVPRTGAVEADRARVARLPPLGLGGRDDAAVPLVRLAEVILVSIPDPPLRHAIHREPRRLDGQHDPPGRRSLAPEAPFAPEPDEAAPEERSEHRADPEAQ